METLIYMAASIISFIIAAYILDRDDEEQDRELEETMKNENNGRDIINMR